MDEPQRPLTEHELKDLQQNLARLSEPSVKQVYQQAWEECRIKGERLPPAKAIQQLVQAWKQLWKRRRFR
jgi:lysozyme family protein